MATLSLKISVIGHNIVKTMPFDPSTKVEKACKDIRDRISEANTDNSQDFGLFLADEDPKKGVWLEGERTLEYYMLRNGDLLEYKYKLRILRVRMLDGSVKTLQVDDSQILDKLMITICTRIGITDHNHKEYSLVRELPDDEKEKTLTLRRDKSIAKDQKKLDEMKRKLHTDDELNWLNHSKTLREQGIDTNETLLLRRKLFYSDRNVDASDPVQLNLLYVQSRDAILNGTHPVTQDEAVQFGGIQCQIQFGDHVETKHKPGFLDLKEFLPKEYVKVKGVEKKIYVEHKKFGGLEEINAKVKYTQLCRSLKTYGITFFLVKEKMKGKNKLTPRLLGITKKSVVRVDEKTKEILETWDLKCVRRWAASPNTFTLDFGDYSDVFYSVQTTEGEQISQLIASYIDIIDKKTNAKDGPGIEGDEESTMLEDSVAPAKATIIQHQSSKVGHASPESVSMPVVLRTGGAGQSTFSTGSLQKAQFSQTQNQSHSGHATHTGQGQNAQVHGLGHAQRALLGTINTGLTSISSAQTDLEQKAQVPDLGSDPAMQKWRVNTMDVSKQKVNAQLSAMNAATAQVVTLTSGGPDETDYTAVGSAVQTISSNMGEFAKDIKMVAALQEDEQGGDKLLDAARRLANAFSDLMNTVQPGTKEPRQNLLTAASKIGEASHDIMKKVADEDEVDGLDKAFQDTLLGLAKAVANATAALVLKAKGVASKCENQGLQNKVISSATQCALATSQLVACTKVVAPTVSNPACQEQLVEAAKLVAKSVEGVVDTAQNACKDDKMLQDLGAAATAVTKALTDLLAHIKLAGGREGHSGPGQLQVGQQEAAVENIICATDRLFGSMGDAPEMVKQARLLAQATSQLVNAIKTQAEVHPDSDMQKKLLAAAKILADATTRMVEAAKGCASSPQDPHHQRNLKQAAENVRMATSAAASDAIKKKLIKRLENAAKQAASSATQLINAAQGAGSSNRNSASQTQLIQQCKMVSDEVIPKLVQSIRGTMANPDSATHQLNLINACQDMIPPGGKMIAASKAAVPTIGDQAAAMSLTNATKTMAAALADLRTITSKAQEACGSLEIEGALDQVKNLEQELQEIKGTAAQGKLMPLPGETGESAALQLGATSKTVGSSMAQLLTAAAQGNENYTGIAARDTANALRVLTNAVRGIAASTNDKDLQQRIIEAAQDVMDKSANLIEEAKKAVNNPTNPDNQTKLAQVAKAVSQALSNCVNCLPGLREVDDAIKHITTISQTLSTGKFPTVERGYSEIQITLSNNAVTLNTVANEIIAGSRDAPQYLAEKSNRFSRAYENFMDSGLQMAGVTKDQEAQGQIVSSLRSVSMMSSKLLLASKSLLADPNAPNARNLLTQAARAVTESINHLITICTTAAPGQKECDNALRQIQMMRNLLDNTSEPINDSSYFECLDGVMDKSKLLATSMSGISNHAKKGDLEDFCDSVRNFATSVCGLTENAAQSAYLVGIADSASEPGRPGLVDQSQFMRANQAIQMACQSLTDPSSSQQQVLSAATTVAKHTSALCNTCRLASSKTANPVAKRHFVQSAKDVANSTANLVKAIKELDSNFCDENRRKCAEAAKPLINAVGELTTFASSPEFASVPAKISKDAKQAQEPIISAGKQMIDGACNMVQAAKQLAANPKDPPTYQLYSNHSKSVSDAIKRLLSSIKDCAPGQRECDSALEKINGSIRDLDQASLAALVSHNLQPRHDNSLQGFQELLLNSAREILEKANPIRQAAKGEAEKLGHLVSSVARYFEPLTDGAIGTASRTLVPKQQMAILDQTKTVAESGLQLMYAAKEGGGNPKANHTHQAIDETADCMMDAVKDLLQTLEEAASQAGVVFSMVDSINKSISKTDKRIPVSENQSFVHFQTDMVRLAKQIARTAKDILGKSSTNVTELCSQAKQLTEDYNALAESSRGAVTTSANNEIGNRIKSTVADLGGTCIELVQDCGKLQGNPTDNFARKDMSDHARQVNEKVGHVLAALQAGSQGTQACINAASTVSGIIGDLDTTILFATAGTLNTDVEDTFADNRESILKTAKALVEDTKLLVSGAASNQEQLAMAAQNSVLTITRLADAVKRGAESLGSEQPEAQVLLINAVKDVASALADLISATKNASGKSGIDPTMTNLKDSAKVMVTNVTSLLKTVKTVEDEHARGTRALESTIEAIGQEIKQYVATEHVEKKYTPEDLIRYTKPITIATAKAVAAGNSCNQEDVIVAANMGRKAVFDLLAVSKGTAATAETRDTRERTIDAGKSTALSYKELLETVNIILQKPNVENRQRLAFISKRVASSVTEIVQAAESIKGSEWIDPDDPTAIAENELLTAANSIEAAAKKLSQLKPRRPARAADESLNFEEQILEAAKSIAAATAALVKSASAAQRELVAQGKIGSRHVNYDSDEEGQWSQGLISAARMVAVATHSLCDAANAMVQGHASEEKLISSAKQVASSTAQLLVACKVKADQDSTAMRRLQCAGNAVKRATEALVRAAQQAKDWADEEQTLTISERMVGGMAQIIMAQEEILIKEKELESARKKLEVIRKAKYKDRPSDMSADESYGSDF